MTGPVGETSQEPSHSLRRCQCSVVTAIHAFVGLLHALLLRVGSGMAEVGRGCGGCGADQCVEHMSLSI